MKNVISTFLGIAVTALAIGILVFGFGFDMIEKEAGEYEQQTDDVTGTLPNATTNTP